jgi:hypothetical protein
MKNRVLRDWSLGVILIVLPLALGCLRESSGQEPNVPVPAQPETSNTNGIEAPVESTSSPAAQSSGLDLENAPVQPMSTDKPLPPSVKPSSPILEVVRLANSGVDQGVLLAFVTNSANTFNLGAEEIIYLNDIGFPGPVVTAMIQHDRALKQSQVAQEPPGSNEVASQPMPALPDSGQYAPAYDTSVPQPEPATEIAPPPDYANESDGPPPTVATDSMFYDSLAPYGTWVNVGGYGPCWQPSVMVINPTWQPYFNCGRWIYSDCGWYWLSGYSWGWAPFHYGRWFRHNRLGWCWSPGTMWGPSWVCWRYTGNYCGWAPLPPGAWYHRGAGLTYHGQTVASSFGFGLSPKSFAFVKFDHFYGQHLPRYAMSGQQVSQIFSGTTVSTGIGFSDHRIINNGIPPSHVAASTHTPTHRIAIHQVTTGTSGGGRAERFGASGNSLSVFRPNTPQAAGTKMPSGTRPQTPGHSSIGGVSGASTALHQTGTTARWGTPLILHGADHAASQAGANVPTATRERVPANALILTGRKDFPRSQSSATWMSGADPRQQERTRAGVPAQVSSPQGYLPSAQPGAAGKAVTVDQVQRADRSPRSKKVVQPDADYGAHTVGEVTTSRAWQQPVSSYQPPKFDYSQPRSVPAPRQNYSENVPSFSPRAQAVESRSAAAPPAAAPAPANSGNAGQGRWSSGRNSR